MEQVTRIKADGSVYEISGRTREAELAKIRPGTKGPVIRLPDGRIITVKYWGESVPPHRYYDCDNPKFRQKPRRDRGGRDLLPEPIARRRIVVDFSSIARTARPLIQLQPAFAMGDAALMASYANAMTVDARAWID